MHMDILDLVAAIRAECTFCTGHADKEAENDKLELQEIHASVLVGEIIETYPEDTPYPSCLVLGWIGPDKPIHTVWAYNAATGYAVLVTVCRPDPRRWIEWKERIKR